MHPVLAAIAEDAEKGLQYLESFPYRPLFRRGLVCGKAKKKSVFAEAVLMSTYNLCFEQTYEKYQNFLSESFHFLVVKISIYLNTVGLFS